MIGTNKFYSNRIKELNTKVEMIEKGELPVFLLADIEKELKDHIDHITEMNKIYAQLIPYIIKEGRKNVD